MNIAIIITEIIFHIKSRANKRLSLDLDSYQGPASAEQVSCEIDDVKALDRQFIRHVKHCKMFYWKTETKSQKATEKSLKIDYRQL